MKQKPFFIRGFGIYCSNSSSYNPKIIEVLYKRKSKEKYLSLGNFKLSLSFGTQILTTEEVVFSNTEKIKFVIKETYGGKKAYINKIFLYENLPKYNFDMSYRNDDINININEENSINKNILHNSNKLNLKDLDMNEITNVKKEKIISNNLPTRTTDILLTESDLTDKPKKKNKKYYKDYNDSIHKESNKNKIENEKQNNSDLLDKEGVNEENISIEDNKKDLNNNSNIIFTNSDDKANAFEDDNNNIIKTISDISCNNKINNCDNDNINNKIYEYDTRISNLENEVNNLKNAINEILNNLNQTINQNKNHFQECKKYTDYKILSTLGNINDKIYYFNTQSYNHNNSHNKKHIETKTLNNNTSEIIYSNTSNNKIAKNKIGNINMNSLYVKNNSKPSKIIDNNNEILNNKNNFKKKKLSKIKLEEEKKIEKILNNQLNKKLGDFNEKIENKIYKSLFKPTLKKLENNLQNDFNSVKEKLRSLSVNYSQACIKSIQSTRPIRYNNYSSYINDLQNNFENNNNRRKSFYKIDINNRNNNNFLEEKNNFDDDKNIGRTEKVKRRNLVEKQRQLNDLIFKLNTKQNESFKYISSRKDNKSFDIN